MATWLPLANTLQGLAYRQQLWLIADIVRRNIALLGYTSIADCCKHCIWTTVKANCKNT